MGTRVPEMLPLRETSAVIDNSAAASKQTVGDIIDRFRANSAYSVLGIFRENSRDLRMRGHAVGADKEGHETQDRDEH